MEKQESACFGGKGSLRALGAKHLSPTSLKCGERNGENVHPQENPILQAGPLLGSRSSFSVPELSLISVDPFPQFYTPGSPSTVTEGLNPATTY